MHSRFTTEEVRPIKRQSSVGHYGRFLHFNLDCRGNESADHQEQFSDIRGSATNPVFCAEAPVGNGNVKGIQETIELVRAHGPLSHI
jgi:hypothetical protein